MEGRNLVLIGMPGAGKSTIGVLLAKTLKMPFVDTDLLIQQKEDELLQDIINSKGIEAFLRIEEEVVTGLRLHNHVIATGGSVVYGAAAMETLKGQGMVLYLQLRLDEIEKRIRNITTRGIAMRQEQSLRDLYRERTPLYEKYADRVVNCSGRTDEELVSEMKDIFRKNL